LFYSDREKKNYAALGFSPHIGTPQSFIFVRSDARHPHEGLRNSPKTPSLSMAMRNKDRHQGQAPDELKG
jgi:hypothetical protein